MESEMREMIINRASEAKVRQQARTKGYGGLLESGVSKILQGLTTAEEVLSVTFTDKTRV
jgi:general secretion pathway protein E/type IV pilus assembly protein PilB